MRKKNSAERIRTVCFFPDYSEISVEGSDTETAVNMISEAGIALRNIRITDEMTVQMTVRTADLGKVREILKQRYRVEVLRSAGYFPLIRRLLRRKGLIAGVFCFIAVIVFQQSFVAEMRIEGNTGIPEEEMSAVLRENGLFVGCSKSSVDEAKIRNSLYASFPELTWVGIEIRGALAVVEVAKEDKMPDVEDLTSDEPCDIVASKAGYIREITVRQGTPVVKSGDYVEAGDVLISSVMKANNTTYDETRDDKTRLVHAAGDVEAVVVYKLEAQFDKGKFSQDRMEKSAENAIHRYVQENIPRRIEILKKDLKFSEEENIIRCGITLEISENIGYEKETEFAGT